MRAWACERMHALRPAAVEQPAIPMSCSHAVVVWFVPSQPPLRNSEVQRVLAAVTASNENRSPVKMSEIE